MLKKLHTAGKDGKMLKLLHNVSQMNEFIMFSMRYLILINSNFEYFQFRNIIWLNNPNFLPIIRRTNKLVRKQKF